MHIAKIIAACTIAAALSSCGEKKLDLGDYPLTTCVVADKKLGSMGDPVLYMYQGQKVYFCCAGCQESFDENPKKYLAKIEVARKK